MSTPNPDTFFVVAVPLLAAWFLLLVLFWHRLIARHPAEYNAMHRPNFFSLVGLRTTLRFMILREHRGLGDRSLGIMSDLALTVLVLCIANIVFFASITGAFK